MISSVTTAERAVKLARSLPTESSDRAWRYARALVSVLPNPADRSRILS